MIVITIKVLHKSDFLKYIANCKILKGTGYNKTQKFHEILTEGINLIDTQIDL